MALVREKRNNILENRKEKLVKNMTDDEFDEMFKCLMEEHKERIRKREQNFEM